MSGPAIGSFSIGQRFTKTVVRNLRRTQIVQYAGASGDFNPMHTDETFAREAVGLPGVFAHGMLTMAMSGSIVSDVFGVDNVVYFGGRFRAQVWPGDTLEVTMRIVDIKPAEACATHIDLSVSTTNQDNVEVFGATAKVVLNVATSAAV